MRCCPALVLLEARGHGSQKRESTRTRVREGEMRNREAKNTSHLTLISVWNLEFGRLNEFILKVLCLGFELRLGGLEFRV